MKHNGFLFNAAAAAAAILLCGVTGYEIQKNTRRQNAKIRQLSDEVEQLKKQLKEETKATVPAEADGYRYLAIGNSITLHGFADYWWDDDRGMAASSDEKDYFHLVKSSLEDTYGKVNATAVNLATWEVNAHDRAEFYSLLDTYLWKVPDLITVQLGENASNLDTWESDWVGLLNYLKNKAPDARLLVIGDFWSNGDRDAIKEKAAKHCNVQYVSLEGIRDNPEYYAGIGTTVEGKVPSERYTIRHGGVANHPGDKGMAAIAQRIMQALDLSTQ